MKKEPCRRRIRDRVLSLFAALAVVAGTVTGFASGKSYEAKAESFTKQIANGGEITYTPGANGSDGTVKYIRKHNKASSNVQYYTKHFILSIGTIDTYKSQKPYDPAHGYNGEGVPKWELVDAGDPKAVEYANKYKAVMFDLEFKDNQEGQSWTEEEIENNGDTFCWWDDITSNTVTTTYKFDAAPIFEFVERFGGLSTQKVYISHIFALKWSNDYVNSDYYNGWERYKEYWTPADMYNIGWNEPAPGEASTPKKIEACYNVEVPLSWNAVTNVHYYDISTGNNICSELNVANTKMADATIGNFTPENPVINIHGRVTCQNSFVEGGVGSIWATAKSDERPALMVTTKGLANYWSTFLTEFAYDTAVIAVNNDIEDAKKRAVADGKSSDEYQDYVRVKKHSLADAFKGKYGTDFTYTVNFSGISRYTRTVNIYVPCKPAGSAVYYNFYDYKNSKAIPGTECVTAGSFNEGTKNPSIGFDIPSGLASEWELGTTGAFDVNAAKKDDIDTYSEVKNHSTKATDGTYSPSGMSYKFKKTIENGKAYVVWIPLVKKAPKKEIWVAYYDSKKQVQIGSAHKVGEAEEGATNVSVDVSLPSGESLPAGYKFDSSGAFDISDATISTYKQYSYAKNYSAKRTGNYTYPNYKISKMDTGKDVIVWVPVSDGGDTPVKVYVRYITVDGKTTLKDVTAPNAILGTAYTYSAETSIVKDGLTYVLAPEAKYGSRPPKAVYSTKSDNLSGTKYTTKSSLYSLALTRDNSNFEFTASAADTKAVKIFIPMIPKVGETNVRIVYIDSSTGEQIGSMIERKDMERGDTIIPGASYPSGYELDLAGSYQRLAVYATGSDGIKSAYADAKSKIGSKLTNINFNNATNCNVDIPMLNDEKLAVKVFVPVKKGGGNDTMLAIKYFYMDKNGNYKFIEKEARWNIGSVTGRYAFKTEYNNILLKNSLYSGGKVYEPVSCLGMLYGDNGTELYGSENIITTSASVSDVFGYANNVWMESGIENKLNFTTMDKGQWHTAYILCVEKVTNANVVVHYIDSETGAEIYKETNKDFLKSDQTVQKWSGIGGSLVWGYDVSPLLRKEVSDASGNVYSPVYFVDTEHVTEKDCNCTDTRQFHCFVTWPREDVGPGKGEGYTYHYYYCTKCGAIVQDDYGSLNPYSGWNWSYSTGDHDKIRTFNYPGKKTRIKIDNVDESAIYTTDWSYDQCSNAVFDFTLDSDDKGVLKIKNPSNPDLGYSSSSTTDSSPARNADGNVMVLYIPCVANNTNKKYDVTVKYITLKDDGSAKDVLATFDGGKAVVGEKYTYTGLSSISKDGDTYNVIGDGEWLAYGSYKYGQAKGDTENVKGNPAEYDGGSSWTTQKAYSQEKDGTLYIPVAKGGMTVTVKYVVVKSNKSIKKTIKEVNGGTVQYNTKYKYTGDTIVTDGSGKEYAVVGSGEALAYGSNSYKDALNDTGNTKGHKSKFNGVDKWTSEKKYNSYENGILYIPVREAIPVTIYYFTPTSGGGCPVEGTNVKFTEAADPGIPGEHYKTVIRSTIVADGKTYVIKTSPSPMPVTGTYPYGVVSDHKVWWNRTGTDIKSGTMAETDIPADVDEFYIIVPLEVTGSTDPEVPEPDPDKGKNVLDDTPKAVVKSDIYDVVKAIPSTEDIYTEVTAKQYLYAFNAANHVGQKSYDVTITQNLTVVSEDDPDVVISTSPLSKTVTVYRNYSYWTIDSFALYVPDKGFVTNMSLNAEKEMEAAFPGTLPTISKKQYGGEANHITEPTYNSSYSMSDVTITEGQTYDFDTVATTYASSMVGEISCKNDYFKFGSKVVLSDTAKSTAADGPTISNLPDAGDIPNIKAKSGNYTIPGEKKNIKYDSAGYVKYTLKDSIGSPESEMQKDIEDINSVKVHTPVVAKLTISEDNLKYVQDVNADKTKAHAVVGRSDSYGAAGNENSTNDFVLDIDFNNGKHISEKGYGTRSDYGKYVTGYGTNVNGTAYPRGVMVMFDFDVMANVGGDTDETNDIYIPKGVWNRIYPSYYVPEWAEPGTHTVKVRVFAVNAEGNDEDEQKNKNTTDTKYVAFDEAEIEISGKMYGLTITSNSSTAPDWKDVFTLSSKIKWMYPKKYGDGTFLLTFDKNKRYYYMAGIRNELGLDMKAKITQTVKEGGKDVKKTTVETKKDRYIYPILDGQSPVLKGAGILKSGYMWNFKIDTVGRVTANENSSLVILPTFYWVSKDGKTREKVDLWYSAKIEGKTYNFVKAGSELDRKNIFKDYALSDTMGIPTAETADVERIRGDKKALSENVPVFTYGMIQLPKNIKTFSNTAYADLMKNKGTGFTYDQLLQLKQTWYFKYALPDVYHVCATGTDVEAYAKKNGGVTYKEDFWKKDGYLVVHFDIGAYDKNGQLSICYTNTAQNVADGMCDMWATEGYVNNRTDSYGTNFTFIDGDVIVCRLPGSTTPPGGNPPGTPPGEPNPPTNSSEDKLVNRTN